MKKQGLIEKAIFGMYLSDSEYGQIAAVQTDASIISFGTFNLSQFSYSESPVYLRVTSDEGHWSLQFDGLYIFGRNIAPDSYSAIIDSGTSLILGPDLEVQSLLTEFENRWKCSLSGGLLECVCGWDPTLAQFPDLEFVLGGYTLVLKPSMYMMRRGAYCWLQIAGIHDPTLWVLGSPFMRGFYTVFDMDNREVGFAPTKSNPTNINAKQSYGSYLVIISLIAGILCSLLIAILVCMALNRSRIEAEEIMMEQPFLA